MNSRELALNILYKVEFGEGYANIEIDKEFNKSDLIDLDKALASEIVYGVLTWKITIDEIIKIIRSSYNDAKERLIERFGFSEIQAQAILDMQLRRLQGLEQEKIENEYELIDDADAAHGFGAGGAHHHVVQKADEVCHRVLYHYGNGYGQEPLVKRSVADEFLEKHSTSSESELARL